MSAWSRFHLAWGICLLLVTLAGPCAFASDPGDEDASRNQPTASDATPSPPEPERMTEATPWNLRLPTLGGRQLWGDVCHFRGWRIQQNVLTGHHRLLDPGDFRHAWGTLEQCRTALEQIKSERALSPLSGKVVILIHGIIRSSKVYTRMSRRLQQEGYEVVLFDYPSTRVSIADSAKYLEKTIGSLEGARQIDLVVHSLGGLIVRSYLQLTAPSPDPRLHRMVMLGVPNQGATLANIAQQNVLYRTIFGPAGQQLIEDEAGLIASLPIPEFEFALISGARGTDEGYNPLIPGDDDGIVSVDCTRLEGAADSMTLPAIHSFLPGNPAAIDATVCFLTTGRLHHDRERQPIPQRRNDVSELTDSSRGSQDSAGAEISGVAAEPCEPEVNTPGG